MYGIPAQIAYNGGDLGVAYEYNFAYDDAGNRTQWQIVGGTTTNYTYDAANKMLTAGNSTFTYDDKGNTLTETNGSITTTYTWDYLNRMTQWQKTGETTQAYVYNADGMRVRVTPSGGTATNFLLDGKDIAENVTGQSVTSYTGPGLVSELSGTVRTTYHACGSGNTRALSDASEIVQAATIYDGYGKLAQEYPSSSAPVFGYEGQFRYYKDVTGLYYLIARYYDPDAAVFVSPDPAGYADGFNVYAYVHGNPTNYVDPLGLWGFGGGGDIGYYLPRRFPIPVPGGGVGCSVVACKDDCGNWTNAVVCQTCMGIGGSGPSGGFGTIISNCKDAAKDFNPNSTDIGFGLPNGIGIEIGITDGWFPISVRIGVQFPGFGITRCRSRVFPIVQ